MSTPLSVPARWTPLRAGIERVLGDGVWRESDLVFQQVEYLVDPRIAIRHWCREYESRQQRMAVRNGEDFVRTPASRVLPTCEEEALSLGKRRVYWDTVRGMRRAGRLQTEMRGGRLRVRLNPNRATVE